LVGSPTALIPDWDAWKKGKVRQMPHINTTLDDDKFQIIGLEFTVLAENQYEELAMFSPQGLVLARRRSMIPGALPYQPAITFHTTLGDYQIRGDYSPYPCPW